MVQHLPPDELLLDYATGSLPEPLALLVAAHVTLSPETRRQVRELEAVGGAMMESEEPAKLPDGALDAVLARLDEAPRTAAAEAVETMPQKAQVKGDGRIPAPLCAYLADGLETIEWRERSGSVAEFDLLPDYPGFKTRLLKLKAGSKVPQHTHGGAEYTLVLEGSFTDETGRYARGDVAVADPEVTHRPQAGSECDCICLAVTDAPLKMTGPLGRVLNYFVDM